MAAVHSSASQCSQTTPQAAKESEMYGNVFVKLSKLRQVTQVAQGLVRTQRPQLQLPVVASTHSSNRLQQVHSSGLSQHTLRRSSYQYQDQQLSIVQSQRHQQHTDAQQATQQQLPGRSQSQLQQAAPSFTAWPGLAAWRAKGVDMGRGWGEKNRPDPSIPPAGAAEANQLQLPGSLMQVALLVLNTADPNMKAALTHRGWKAYCAGQICLHPEDAAAQVAGSSTTTTTSSSSNSSSAGEPVGLTVPQQQQQQQQLLSGPPYRPARPDKPELVIPKQVPSPKDSHLPLSAHLLHNLAHIELNAVDLAMDTVARFSHLRLPDGFYEDFARVADDEARHFGWCVQRLAELGHSYGDMVAHDLLWEGAQASAGNLAARLAVVPMSQEARGLDAGQRLATRLVGTGDNRSASIVNRIAEEERAHVAVGVEWFGRLCVALGVDPPAAFRAWVSSLGPELLKGPFNHQERHLVGLHKEFYDISSWPQELQQQTVAPAVAAAAKGQGMQVPAAPQPPQAAAGPQTLQQQGVVQNGQQPQSVNGGTMQQLMSASAVPDAGPELEVLRQRLWDMLQSEADACNM